MVQQWGILPPAQPPQTQRPQAVEHPRWPVLPIAVVLPRNNPIVRGRLQQGRDTYQDRHRARRSDVQGNSRYWQSPPPESATPSPATPAAEIAGRGCKRCTLLQSPPDAVTVPLTGRPERGAKFPPHAANCSCSTDGTWPRQWFP